MKHFGLKLLALLMLLATAGAAFWYLPPDASASSADYRTARVERREFKQFVRRHGTLTPVNEEHIFSQLMGSILEMAEQGKVVAKGDVVLTLDATPFENEKADQEAAMATEEAEFKKTQQEAAKVLNHAKEDVESCILSLDLESGQRLAELKKGPTPIDKVNAEMLLENDKNVLAAKVDEVAVYGSLAAAGFESQEVLRQKKLEMTQQTLKVDQSDIALRKLLRLDPVKIAEQDLKVKDAVKAQNAAKDRVILLEGNMKRDLDKHNQHMDRQRKTHSDMLANIAKTVIRAPAAGVVVHKKNRWYTFSPGRNVFDGVEIMSLPDFSTMKAILAVDEGKIANVQAGQHANIMPAGWRGKPFQGKVIKVAEKCRDEFETFNDETTAISGAANRQVFDVEVEIEGKSTILRPGLRAEVEIVLQKLDNVLVVPRSALQRAPDETTVRVNTADGVATRKVKVLGENDLVAAVEGVNEGERVWVVPE